MAPYTVKGWQRAARKYATRRGHDMGRFRVWHEGLTTEGVFTDLFTATCRACGRDAVLRFRHWDGGQDFEITGDACDVWRECSGEALPARVTVGPGPYFITGIDRGNE